MDRDGKKYSTQINAHFPDGIYLLKVNDRNIRTRCEVCSRLTIKAPEQRRWHISIDKFKHVIAGWAAAHPQNQNKSRRTIDYFCNYRYAITEQKRDTKKDS